MNLTGDSCFHLVKNGMHNDILPVFFQYTNRLEDKYFLCVRTDLMYNRKYRDVNFNARFYINLPYISYPPSHLLEIQDLK